MYYAFGPFRMAQIRAPPDGGHRLDPDRAVRLHRYFSTPPAALAGGVRRRLDAADAVEHVRRLLHRAADRGHRCRPAPGARGERARIARQLAVAAVLRRRGARADRGRVLCERVRSYEQVRPIDEIVANSADLRAYVVGKNTVGAWRWLPTMVGTDPEKELFPGLFAIGLAAVGVAAGVSGERRRHWIGVYGAIAIAAIALSLGPQPRVWGTVITRHGPYAWLAGMVPGMDGMRVPARFAIIFVAALSVLIAFGVDHPGATRQARSRTSDRDDVRRAGHRGRMGRLRSQRSRIALAAAPRTARRRSGSPAALPARSFICRWCRAANSCSTISS